MTSILILLSTLASSPAHAGRGDLVPLPLCTTEQISHCSGEAQDGILECSSDLLDCMIDPDPVACIEELAESHDVDTTENFCQEVGTDLFGSCIVDEECSSPIDLTLP